MTLMLIRKFRVLQELSPVIATRAFGGEIVVRHQLRWVQIRSTSSACNNMPYFSCCVPECTASKRKLQQLDKYPWMRGVTFISLPDKRKNRREYLRWLRLIRREVCWKTTKYTRICSRHFAQGETVPTLFPYNNFKSFALR